jgi:TldD protein
VDQKRFASRLRDVEGVGKLWIGESWIANLTGVRRSHGCSFADSWSSVQFQRMPNISLMPGEAKTSLDDIIAATERGVVVKNRGSWSIDQQRYNFQFSGQLAY